MNETQKPEDTLIELHRLKLIKEMFDLLTEDEKHEMAVSFVKKWFQEVSSWKFSDIVEQVFREVVRDETQTHIDTVRARINSNVDVLSASRIPDNEIYQTATWRQRKRVAD